METGAAGNKSILKQSNPGNLNDIIGDLSHYVDITRALCSQNRLDESLSEELISTVVTIRILMNDLQQSPHVPRHHSRSIDELQKRCLELEGILKEIRNDRR